MAVTSGRAAPLCMLSPDILPSLLGVDSIVLVDWKGGMAGDAFLRSTVRDPFSGHPLTILSWLAQGPSGRADWGSDDSILAGAKH